MEAATVTTETREPQIPADKLGMRISDGAVAFAKEKLAKRGTPDAAIRLGIKGGGCSGFSYVIQFEDDPPRERDRVYDIEGVRFIVDKKSLIYLAGSLLDYERTLMFQGFKFRNPNEASSCGCGHSFTVK
ncbi:MAG: iron-sulfur cluster assembly accessory protein [Myxococcales bacterium]|nr:iron-sulfur cluster assembly accessory protein [Myxococcales bacterium]MCB9575592.1 iron-sulfur cluster assembly accessory protein [Polyangiaceae bacterium]